MKIWLLVGLVFLAVVAGALQSTSDRVYVWTLSGGYFRLLEVTGMVRTSMGWTLPSAPTGDVIANGQGIVLTRVPGQPVVVSVATEHFYLRVAPPAAPGDCTPSIPLSGQQVMSHDNKSLYVCVVTEVNGVKQGQWGRTPLEFSW